LVAACAARWLLANSASKVRAAATSSPVADAAAAGPVTAGSSAWIRARAWSEGGMAAIAPRATIARALRCTSVEAGSITVPSSAGPLRT